MASATALRDEASTAGVPAASAAAARLVSIDIVRGAVMALMALDHVRLFITNAPFDPTNLSRTTFAYFMTRWITHFCAPAFVFFAGTAAFLHGERLASRRALSRYLLTRGLWLILLETSVIRLSWTFNLDYAHYLLGGVIWMIGWCMVLMAGLVHLPFGAVAALGVLMIAGHNIVDGYLPSLAPVARASRLAWLWQILYLGGGVPLVGTSRLAVLFVIVPWVGVMAAGYAFGRVVQLPSAARRRACLQIGVAATALFVLLRGFNLYGNPRPWTAQPTPLFSLLAVLNTAKYPASFAFLLMTLGPTIALLPALERAQGWLARALAVFGRTPLFFYLLHIPLIHAVACVLSLSRYGAIAPWLYLNHPMGVSEPPPEGWGYNLAVVYLVTTLVVVALYFPCRWYAALKARKRSAWLSYL